MLWPLVSHGEARVARKGEDFHSFDDVAWKPRSNEEGLNLKIFAVFDGHGGTQSAQLVKDKLVGEFIQALSDLTSSADLALTSWACWELHHVKALQTAFVKLDEQCRSEFNHSGTTATVVIVVQEHFPDHMFRGGHASRSFITVANVGDSNVYLDNGVTMTRLNDEHRAGANKSESKRVEESGGTISRDDSKSPFRLYPGGLMMTRTIGDRDAHQAIANPAISELALRVEVGGGGGRLILASDGLWDAVGVKETANLIRKTKSPSNCAKALIRECTKREGRNGDDVTVFVIDISDIPETPFQKSLPAENAPNRSFYIWRPLIENPPDLIKHLLVEKQQPGANDKEIPIFKEGEIVYEAKDADKKQFKVAVSEGPMVLLSNKGWIAANKLSHYLSPHANQTALDAQTALAIEQALLQEEIVRSESPPWEEPTPSRRKKQTEEKTPEKSLITESKGPRTPKSIEKTPQDKASKPKGRGRNRKDRSIAAASVQGDPANNELSNQQPVTSTSRATENPEFMHDFFATGFPEDWNESNLVEYFSGYCQVSGLMVKTHEESQERGAFFTFTKRGDLKLEDDVCGRHIINQCHMFVALVRDAFEDST